MSMESDEAINLAQAEVAFKTAQLAIAKAKAEGATTLILSDYALDQIPVEIGTLNTLTELQLVNTQVRDLSPISALSSLSKLSVVFAPVEDIGPIEKLTNLVYLDLRQTHAKDITPLSNLTKLEVIDLAYIGVHDVAALSALTRLRQINMKNNSVLDFRPFRNIVIPESASERPDDFWGFVQCLNENIGDFDPQFSDMLDRGLAGFRNAIVYLNDLDDADYDRRLAEWRARGYQPPAVPEQDDALTLMVIGGKIDLAPATPGADELADPVKIKALERLRSAVETLRRAGNQHEDIDVVSRRLSAQTEKPLGQLDMLEVHFDLEVCRGIYDRRGERTGEDILSAATIGALDKVCVVGPGLTLDNAEVERLERRRRDYDGPAPTPQNLGHQNALSQSIIATPDLFGDHLRAVSARFPGAAGDHLDRARVAQNAGNRNVVIRFGLWATVGLAGGALGGFGGAAGTAGWAWLALNGPDIMALSAAWGGTFQAWIAPIVAQAQEIQAAAQAALKGIR